MSPQRLHDLHMQRRPSRSFLGGDCHKICLQIDACRHKRTQQLPKCAFAKDGIAQGIARRPGSDALPARRWPALLPLLRNRVCNSLPAAETHFAPCEGGCLSLAATLLQIQAGGGGRLDDVQICRLGRLGRSSSPQSP